MSPAIHTPLCSACDGTQTVTLAADPGVLWPCPSCAVDLDDRQDDRFVEDWEPWTAAEEGRSWLDDDRQQERRADR